MLGEFVKDTKQMYKDTIIVSYNLAHKIMQTRH